MGKGDIQNPQKQDKLERWNNIAPVHYDDHLRDQSDY